VGEPVDKLVPGLRLAAGHNLDVTALRRDGRRVPVEVSVSPLESLGQTYLTATIRDVSERKRAEETRARLAAILESTDDAVYSRDPDGTIDTWNAGAERLYGYTGAEIIGKPAALLRPALAADECASADGAQVTRFETVRLRQDGSSVEVALTVSPIHAD